MSSNDAVIAAWNDEANLIHIFDRGQKKLVKSIQIEQTAMFEDEQVFLAPDGKRVLFKIEGMDTSVLLVYTVVFILNWLSST